ncbi:Pepco domain-containing protein [Microcoleus vaginatus]|uniref:Pepco domain-containing protein n=1 Tax=Microcoleus vaginatus TaxID=119532 RepID=UPI0032AD715D
MPDETIRIVTSDIPGESPQVVTADGGKSLGMGGAPFLDMEPPSNSSQRPKVPDATGEFRIHNVSVETLEQEMAHLLAVVDRLLIRSEEKRARKSKMELEEIELSVEINGQGQISIIGNGAAAGGKGAIKLKFKREQSK